MATVAPPQLGQAESLPPAMPHVRRRAAVALVVIAAVALAIVALPGLDDVRARFAEAQPGWLGVAGLLEAASLLSYVVVFRPTFCSKLPWGLSYRIGLAEQGTNVLVPTGGAGGLALGAWALRRTGMPADHIARRSVAFFLITSGANFATAIVAGAALALGLVSEDVGLALTAGPAVLAALTMLAVGGLPSLMRRLPEADPEHDGRVRVGLDKAAVALGDGVADARTLLTSRQPAIIGGAVGYMAFDMAALWAGFHALGAAPAGLAFVLAYVIGQLGGLIPIPGGLGGADGGLVGALAVYGSPVATAAAAVLAYRVFQLGLPTVLGTVAFVQLRKDPAQAVPGGPCAAP